MVGEQRGLILEAHAGFDLTHKKRHKTFVIYQNFYWTVWLFTGVPSDRHLDRSRQICPGVGCYLAPALLVTTTWSPWHVMGWTVLVGNPILSPDFRLLKTYTIWISLGNAFICMYTYLFSEYFKIYRKFSSPVEVVHTWLQILKWWDYESYKLLISASRNADLFTGIFWRISV